MFSFTNSEWVEASFKKRECRRIIPSAKYASRCYCGLAISAHSHTSPTHALSATSKDTEKDEPEENIESETGYSPNRKGSLLPQGQSFESPSSSTGNNGSRPQEHWNPFKHTIAIPTDAYGCIDFRGTHTNKAQYIRLAHDTKPELVLTLLLREWCLEKPKLLITVTGGKANFDLQPRIKWSLRKGLLKAAKTTGAWIFTGGTNTGVNKHVGDALVSEKSPRIKGGRVVSIGIAPWGVVEKRRELIGKGKDVPFHTITQPRSRFAALNKHHAYFLLVDNGTIGKYGAEIALRRKLEKFISTQSLSDSAKSEFSTPLVCLVIEGGTNTIRAVLEYVTATPPVPVVVCDGTGRAADLIAFVHKYASDDGDLGAIEDIKDHIIHQIKKTFDVSSDQAAKLYLELRQCIKRRHLITIFRCSGDRGEKPAMLDEVILTALFKAQHLRPVEQLTLALTWNRCDIARKEIFTYGQDWPPGALEFAMQEALELDRVDFVRLLLEQGINMNKFLNVKRLEALYNSKRGPANTLGYIVRDVVPRMPRGYRYSVADIGLVINQLMGTGYNAVYTQKKYKPHRNVGMSTSTNIENQVDNLRVQPNPDRNQRKGSLGVAFKSVNGNDPTFNNKAIKRFSLKDMRSKDIVGSEKSSKPTLKKSFSTAAKISLMSPKHVFSNEDEYYSQTFEFPFSDLIVWAVLTKRQEMAKLMWQHGEQNLAKALAASRLYQAMALEAADDDLDPEICDELTMYSKVFEELALDLLEYCYQSDDDLTEYLLTASLDNWSRQTCLKLAVTANNLKFLAHPLSQAILANLWMGGLRMRKNPGFKIALGLFFPLTILQLEFKTREELELMPQTEEELQDRDDRDSSSSSTSSSSSSSRRSSINHNDLDSLSSVEMGNGITGKLLGRKRGEAVCSTKLESKLETLWHMNDENTFSTRINSNKNSSHPDHLDIGISSFFQSEGFLEGSNFLSKNDTVGKKKTRPLKWKKKLYEFYAAPVTKYYSHLFAYLIFLTAFTYIVLVKTPNLPSLVEYYVAACMANFFLEKIRQIIATEPTNPFKKIQAFVFDTHWNICDVFTIVSFLIAFALRLMDTSWIKYCRVVYATLITYWYVRSLKLIGVNKYFGQYVMMIGKMIAHMFYFVVLLLVVLMAFGICRQAILFPNEEPDWLLVRHIFYQPYFMLYGEVFAGDIDPVCNATCTEYEECGANADGSLKVPCQPGHWVTPIMMTIYLLVANILLLNLLIATFNTIYNEVNQISQQYWHFKRFTVVMEYEEKPILPAPFTFMSHIFRICKYVYRRCRGLNPRFQTGLKVYLSKYDLERLYDFEEECAEGLMQQKEDESMKKTDVRVKSVLDMMEDVRSKMEDLERWENLTQESNQTMDFRLQKLEDIAQNTKNQISVIHRFMASQNQSDSNGGNTTAISEEASEAESTTNLGPLNDLEPIASCDSREENIIDKSPTISKEEKKSLIVNNSELEPALPQAILTHPSKEWIQDAQALTSLTKKISEEGIGKEGQSAQEGNEGEKVRFQIDHDFGHKEEDNVDNDITLQCPLVSISLAENDDSKESPSYNTTSNKPDHKQKRKISKTSTGKPDQYFKQNYGDKNKFASNEKRRHMSSESRGSNEFRRATSVLSDERPFQGRLRRYTESSAGARTSEDESHLLSQQSARRRASRMEQAMVGRVLGRQKRVLDVHDTKRDQYPRKRLSTSKDSQDEDTKEHTPSGRSFYRSQSEIGPALPSTTNIRIVKDSKASHSDEDLSDTTESEIETAKHRLSVFPMNRKIHSRKQHRHYTSITDQLEEMISVTPHIRSESRSPRPDIPAIEIETKCLHDAEEMDYNLMENLIEKRLRRDSHNLAASLEELVTKSIRDESSSSSNSSSSTTSCCPDDSDSHSELSDSSKRNKDIQSKDDYQNEMANKSIAIRKKSRKTSFNQQRSISLCAKQPPCSSQKIKKHRNRRDKKSGKKKRSMSKISLASLEIVEEQIAVVTGVSTEDRDEVQIVIEEDLKHSSLQTADASAIDIIRK